MRRKRRPTFSEWVQADRDYDRVFRRCMAEDDHKGCTETILRSEANSVAYFGTARSNFGIAIFADEREVPNFGTRGVRC